MSEQTRPRMPLEGVRVLDFCWVLAGPTCTAMLAQLGAEVIKVESWARMDQSRATVRRGQKDVPQPNQNTGYNATNLNKLGVTVNTRDPRGIGLLKELAGISDVVTNNFAAGVMDRMGLGYEDLAECRPDIIMLSMSGFGATGPAREYHGYQPTFESLAGISDMSGYPGGPPTRSGAGAHIDIVNGMMAAAAALMALEHRLRTGEGQLIDLSEWEVPVSLVGESFVDWSMNGRSPARRGNRDDCMAPHNCYPCKGEDRWVSIAVASEDEWFALCSVMGNPAWARARRFADAYSRWQNQDELDRLIGEWTKQLTHYEVMEALQKVGVAAMPSFDQQELLSDPHVVERGCWMPVEHPEAGVNLVLGPTWKLSRTPARTSRPAPLVGEHNELVFLELLGMPVDQFAAHVGEQVIF